LVALWRPGKSREDLLQCLDEEFGIAASPEYGYASTEAMRVMAKGEVGAFVWPVRLGARKLLHRAHGVVAEVCRAGCIYLNRAQLMRRGTRQDVIDPAHAWLRRPRRQAPGWRLALNGKRIFIVNKTQVRLRSVSSHLLAEPVILARMAETIFGHNQAVGWKAMVE